MTHLFFLKLQFLIFMGLNWWPSNHDIKYMLIVKRILFSYALRIVETMPLSPTFNCCNINFMSSRMDECHLYVMHIHLFSSRVFLILWSLFDNLFCNAVVYKWCPILTISPHKLNEIPNYKGKNCSLQGTLSRVGAEFKALSY